MANPSQIEKMRQAGILQGAMRRVPKLARQGLAKAAIGSQIVRKQKLYYSTVRFQFTVTGAGPYTYTLAAGTRVNAFSYGKGDSLVGAGFPAAFGNATEAETNLQGKGDTAGATVTIYGLSLAIDEDGVDAALVRAVWKNTFVDVTLNGSDRYVLIGKPGRIPASGGLFGGGPTLIETPPATQSQKDSVGTLVNGFPDQSNFLRLAEPLKWFPTGQIDSRFQVRFETARAIVKTATARAAVDADTIVAFAPPTTTGDPYTFVDVTTYLHTVEMAPRSIQG